MVSYVFPYRVSIHTARCARPAINSDQAAAITTAAGNHHAAQETTRQADTVDSVSPYSKSTQTVTRRAAYRAQLDAINRDYYERTPKN